MGISVYNLLILEGLGFKSLLWPWADRRSENQLLLHLENGAVVPLCGVFVRIKRNDPEESSRSRHSCLLWSRSRGGPAGSHQNCSVSCSGVRPHSDILWGKIAAILLARVNRHGAWGLCAVSHGRKVWRGLLDQPHSPRSSACNFPLVVHDLGKGGSQELLKYPG